jgi:hypothetical protein
MQMPGNDELSIQERANLLKLGVHGIVLLRLAYRYESKDDKLYLSNGLSINENLLMTQAFGCYGHTFFQFCRIFNRLELTIEEFVLLCCIVFFSHGRKLIQMKMNLYTFFFSKIDRIENQITRNKIEQIQIRYCEIERLYITKTRLNNQIHFSKLLLLLSKLRALDALIAERLLCLQMNTDGQVQKCIFEVLHREATNILEVNYSSFFEFIYNFFFKDMEINFLDAIDYR